VLLLLPLLTNRTKLVLIDNEEILLRLTKQTDYGIVLMTHICREPEVEFWAARDLADRTGISQAMVGKILKMLARANFLTSQRGSQGGYRLASDAKLISIADLVKALDGTPALTDCLLSHNSNCKAVSCTLKQSWQRINDAIFDALEGITLYEMSQEQKGESREII
jgi:FeS assembly SUF system regulator